jgi:hypothetical protein
MKYDERPKLTGDSAGSWNGMMPMCISRSIPHYFRQPVPLAEAYSNLLISGAISNLLRYLEGVHEFQHFEIN